MERVETEIGWICRGCILQVQGSHAIEELYKKEVAEAGGGGWPQVKAQVGKVVAEEVAGFLGFPYPNISPGVEDRLAMERTARNRLTIVEDFIDLIQKPRLIINVNPKPLRTPGQQDGRVPGSFSLQLDFGSRMLCIKETLTDGLTALLREKCGEPVYEDGYNRELLGIECVPRPARSATGTGAEAASVPAPAAEAPAGGAEAVGPTDQDPEADMGDVGEGDGPTLTKWLLITLPPPPSRGGRRSQGRRPAPGAVPKAAAKGNQKGPVGGGSPGQAGPGGAVPVRPALPPRQPPKGSKGGKGKARKGKGKGKGNKGGRAGGGGRGGF